MLLLDKWWCWGWGKERVGNYCLVGTEFQLCKCKSAGGGLHNVSVLNSTQLYKEK